MISDRKRKLRSSACMLSLFLALTAPAGSPAAPARDGSPGGAAGTGGRPNVLIILLDDMRADELLRVMPRTKVLFKERGTRFANMFATTPLCCPSRTSILTGEYAHNHHVTGQRQRPAVPDAAEVHARGLPQESRIQDSDPRQDPQQLAVCLETRATSTSGASREEATTRPNYNINGRVKSVDKYSTTFLADQTKRILDGFERKDERPWFIEVSTYAAHSPYLAQKRYEDARVPRWGPEPRGTGAGPVRQTSMDAGEPDRHRESRPG